MFGILESIGVKCQGPVAVGWLTHLYLIKVEDIAFDVFPDTLLKAMNPLWLTGAKMVTEIKLRSKTTGFSESLQSTANGPTYPYQISVPVPSLANEMIQRVYQNTNRRFVAIFRDTAGSCYMAVTKTNGCRLTWSRSVQQVSAQQMQLTGINCFRSFGSTQGCLKLTKGLETKLYMYSRLDGLFAACFGEHQNNGRVAGQSGR